MDDGTAEPEWQWDGRSLAFRLFPVTSPSSRSLSDRLFLALVALLPLHTVFVRVEVAWKPWLILLAAVAALDLWEERGIPLVEAGWHSAC